MPAPGLGRLRSKAHGESKHPTRQPPSERGQPWESPRILIPMNLLLSTCERGGDDSPRNSSHLSPELINLQIHVAECLAQCKTASKPASACDSVNRCMRPVSLQGCIPSLPSTHTRCEVVPYHYSVSSPLPRVLVADDPLIIHFPPWTGRSPHQLGPPGPVLVSSFYR